MFRCRFRVKFQRKSTIHGCWTGWTPPGAIDDKELLLHEQAVSDDGLRTTRPRELGDRCQ